jgi:hypothetical protein
MPKTLLTGIWDNTEILPRTVLVSRKKIKINFLGTIYFIFWKTYPLFFGDFLFFQKIQIR